MEEIKQKTNVLVEVLPYIQKYSGKIFVIKYGGKIMESLKLKKKFMKDIALLNHIGIKIIIVHGGGLEITKEMAKENIKPKFIEGLRYTDRKIIKIVRKVFLRINKRIRKLLENQKCIVEDITDELINTKIKDSELGLVGEIIEIDKEKVLNKLNKGIIPVISPIGYDGKDYNNINGDTVATKIAEEVGAEKLTILTDVDGVYEKGKLIPHLNIEETKKMIKDKIINKGMVPKVLACISAVNNNVKKAHLINGTIRHSLLLEVFTNKGIGTMIVKE